MAKLVFFKDMVEPNGRTVFQNNMEKQHNIPVGALVEVKFDNPGVNGSCQKIHARLWVVEQGRDCDGTPLYWLSETPKSRWDEVQIAWLNDGIVFRDDIANRMFYNVRGGFPEESLTVVPLTQDVITGADSLDWNDLPDE